jgi:uncharacterized membrane protein YjjP (DUF1212 family)
VSVVPPAPATPPTGVPAVEPLSTATATGAVAAARQRSGGRPRTAGWRRVIGTEEQTRQLPVVERLRGTPFAAPHRMAAPADASDARASLDLLVRLAVLLLRSGAGMAEAESSVVAAAIALGLDDERLDVDITWSSVTLGYDPVDGPPVARLQVVRTSGTEFARLSAAHALVLDLVDGRVDRADLSLRMSQVERAARPYRRSIVRVAWGLLAVAVAARLGGGPLALVAAFGMAVAVDAGARAMSRAGAASFFVVAAGAFVAGALSSGVTLVTEALTDVVPPGLLGAAPSAALVVASGIVVLLPGGALVAAVEDALDGFPVTAAARLVTVLMTTAAIAGGVVLSIELTRRAGLPGVDPAAAGAAVGGALTPTWVALVATALGAGAAAVAYRTPPRLLVVTAVAAVLGTGVQVLVSDSEGARAFGTLAAAAVVGAVGRVAALRRRATPLAVVVPGTIMLLPGLTFYTALVELTGGTVVTGLVLLGEAVAIALGIGAGVALGDAVAAPVERGLDQVGRRRRQAALRS